jgi:hypothetical protein
MKTYVCKGEMVECTKVAPGNWVRLSEIEALRFLLARADAALEIAGIGESSPVRINIKSALSEDAS